MSASFELLKLGLFLSDFGLHIVNLALDFRVLEIIGTSICSMGLLLLAKGHILQELRYLVVLGILELVIVRVLGLI